MPCQKVEPSYVTTSVQVEGGVKIVVNGIGGEVIMKTEKEVLKANWRESEWKLVGGR